ncbi:MAG: hypothetical protein F4Y11_06925 [Chloroflexi bacterium]|nr:hypothetical protein [Chloroflexota bacterium]
MRRRLISAESVEAVVDAPGLRVPDRNDPTIERFFGRYSLDDDRVLRVAVNTTASPWRIVTVFFDHRMRGRL